MLGAIPDFNNGAVIAVLMLVPAVFGVLLLNYLEKLNFHYDKSTDIELITHKGRDIGFGIVSSIILMEYAFGFCRHVHCTVFTQFSLWSYIYN